MGQYDHIKIDLRNCTSEQKTAITCNLDPTILRAGAGSGKTFVLTRRVLWLMKERKIDPKRILIVSFSGKSVGWAKHKLKDLGVPESALKKLSISTIHKFCMNFLTHYKRIEWSGKKILKDWQITNLYKDIVNNYLGMTHIGSIFFLCKVLNHCRGRVKREGDRPMTVEDIYESYHAINGEARCSRENFAIKYPAEDLITIYNAYDDHVTRNHLFSFDDMLTKTHLYLSKDKFIRHEYANKYDAILVDEFQDVDHVQFEILKLISGPKTHVFVVGDPDQSIYSFRGALPNIFNLFQEHFEQERHVNDFQLTTNFRSTKQVLDTANALINASKDPGRHKKYLEPYKGQLPGERCRFYMSDSLKDDAGFILQEIDRIQIREQLPPKEICVLGRTRKMLQKVKFAMIEHRMGYNFIGEQYMPETSREEIKDLVAWISIAIDEEDRIIKPLKRVINRPNRGIGPVKQKAIFGDKENHVTPEQVIQNIKNSKYGQVNDFWYYICENIRNIAQDSTKTTKERLEDIVNACRIKALYKSNEDKLERIKAFVKALGRDHKTLEEIRDHLRVWKSHGDSENDVTISTIHSVKGKEFEHVFLIGFTDKHLPSDYARRYMTEEENEKKVEEERRLAYVAFTRAKKGLSIFCDMRDKPSRFYEDMGKEVDLYQLEKLPNGDFDVRRGDNTI